MKVLYVSIAVTGFLIVTLLANKLLAPAPPKYLVVYAFTNKDKWGYGNCWVQFKAQVPTYDAIKGTELDLAKSTEVDSVIIMSFQRIEP